MCVCVCVCLRRYGRVYKATWKGVCVAVKTMTLKEHHRTEQMAIMETAISSR